MCMNRVGIGIGCIEQTKSRSKPLVRIREIQGLD